jgi:hypothetical protein
VADRTVAIKSLYSISIAYIEISRTVLQHNIINYYYHDSAVSLVRFQAIDIMSKHSSCGQEVHGLRDGLLKDCLTDCPDDKSGSLPRLTYRDAMNMCLLLSSGTETS